MITRYRPRIIEAFWLTLLILYAASGMKITPFHGDEAMHIYTSRDYAIAFINRQPEQLLVVPPFDMDSTPRLRLLNGSVMRYSVGLSWHLAGLAENDLPPRPGWDWGMFYDQNVETGHRPTEPLLFAARTVAVIYLALSIIAIYGIGTYFGGRLTAFIVSALYTFNPIILLNGRRALVESALLCFALLLILVTLHIVRQREQHGKTRWYAWLALILASTLTLASKYSGTVLVAGAFGGIFAAECFRVCFRAGQQTIVARLKMLLKPVSALIVSGLLTILLLIVISPAFWSDPINRARDLAVMLQEQVEVVVSIQPDAPTTIPQRIEDIITQPFLRSPQFFEQASWADAAPITAEIEHYMASPLSGIQWGVIFGSVLTLLALVGTVATLWPCLRPYDSYSVSIVLWVCLLLMLANLLVNPLPWQRYYLAYIPLVSLLSAVGITALLQRFRPKIT